MRSKSEVTRLASLRVESKLPLDTKRPLAAISLFSAAHDSKYRFAVDILERKIDLMRYWMNRDHMRVRRQ